MYSSNFIHSWKSHNLICDLPTYLPSPLANSQLRRFMSSRWVLLSDRRRRVNEAPEALQRNTGVLHAERFVRKTRSLK